MKALAIALLLAIIPIGVHGAGVTIITHGFQLTNGPTPIWLSGMRASIKDRWIVPYSQDQEAEYGEIRISQVFMGPLVGTIESWPTNIDSELGEFLIIVNWANESTGCVNRNETDI